MTSKQEFILDYVLARVSNPSLNITPNITSIVRDAELAYELAAR